MKRYNDFINEELSVRDAMRPKSKEEIEQIMLSKDIWSIIEYINDDELDKQYYPSDDKIIKELDEMDIEDRFSTINEYDLDKDKFLPSNKIVQDCIIMEINNGIANGISVYENSGKTYIKFDEWSCFSEYFDRDINDFCNGVLSGDGYEYFMYGEYSYSGYDDVDDNTLGELKTHIKTIIDENKLDINLDDYDTLKKLYELCEEYDDLEDIKNIIDIAYDNAQNNANDSLAYNELTNAILEHYGIENTYKWNDEKKCFISEFNTDSIITTNNFVESYKYGYCEIDINDYLTVYYSPPYNGYTDDRGDIDETFFSEILSDKLNEI